MSSRNIKEEFQLIKRDYLTDLNFKHINIKELYKNKNIDELIKKYNIDLNEFYYEEVNDSFIRFFYIYNGFILDIYKEFDMEYSFKQIYELQKEFDEYFIYKKPLPVFLFYKASKFYAPYMLNFLYKFMIEEDIKTVVKDIQKHNDYNANNISKDILKFVFKDTLDIINDFTKDGFIEVYRGQGSKSLDYKTAYSWTLNKDVALFFSTRAYYAEDDLSKIKVYKAKIPKDYIIGVIVDNEEEILIDSECFYDDKTKVVEINFNKDSQYPMPKERKYLTYKYEPQIGVDTSCNSEEEITIHPSLLNLFS